MCSHRRYSPIILAWSSWLMNHIPVEFLARQDIADREDRNRMDLTMGFIWTTSLSQLLVQLLFSFAHCRWVHGKSSPSGAGCKMLSVIYNVNQVFMATILLVSLPAALRWLPALISLLLVFFSLLAGWKQFQITSALSLQKMFALRTNSFYMACSSREVEKDIPEIMPSVDKLRRAISEKRKTHVLQSAADLLQIVSSYRIKVMVAMASSAFSIIAISFNMWTRLPGKFNFRPGVFDAYILSSVALTLAARIILDGVFSLLGDRGHTWAPICTSFRSTVASKAFLTISKVVITVQDQIMSSDTKSAFAFALLLTSAAVSFGTDILLSWRRFKTQNARFLQVKGQHCPKSIICIYRLLWVAVKGGLLLFGVLAASYQQISYHRLDGTRMGITFFGVGFFFIFGSLLVNELALLQADPYKDFSAISCGEGGLFVSVLIVLFCPFFAEKWLRLLLQRRHEQLRPLWQLDYLLFVDLLVIWVCSLLILCTLSKQPVERSKHLSEVSEAAAPVEGTGYLKLKSESETMAEAGKLGQTFSHPESAKSKGYMPLLESLMDPFIP